MDNPHNSLLAVLAEEGGIGFCLYVASQLLFVRAMWRLRKLNILGWRAVSLLHSVYTIFGLDAGISYYSDLNLFYMFVLGIVLQIQLCMLPKRPFRWLLRSVCGLASLFASPLPSAGRSPLPFSVACSDRRSYGSLQVPRLCMPVDYRESASTVPIKTRIGMLGIATMR